MTGGEGRIADASADAVDRASGPVAGVVPAAGRSTRMGSSKALLDAGGRTFLQRVVGSLAGGGCTPVLVVVRDPRGPEAAMARAAGAEVLENPDPSDGPISSLRVALASLDSNVVGCALCPVDHPRIDPDTVAGLLAVFRRCDAPVVVPRHEQGWGHPVLLHRDLFSEFMEEGLEEGARTVIRRHHRRVREVGVDDEGVLVDIDTLGEYRRHYPESYRKRFHSR